MSQADVDSLLRDKVRTPSLESSRKPIGKTEPTEDQMATDQVEMTKEATVRGSKDAQTVSRNKQEVEQAIGVLRAEYNIQIPFKLASATSDEERSKLFRRQTNIRNLLVHDYQVNLEGD